MIFNLRLSLRFAMTTLSCAFVCFAQKDPGVRGGPPGAGGPIKGLQLNELALFNEGKARTTQLESVCNARSATNSRRSEDPAASWCRIHKIHRISTGSRKIQCSI
jgi:hypothetical protein